MGDIVETDDLVAEAITSSFGERCPEAVNDGCPVCDAWAQYDRLRSAHSEEIDRLEEQLAMALEQIDVLKVRAGR